MGSDLKPDRSGRGGGNGLRPPSGASTISFKSRENETHTSIHWPSSMRIMFSCMCSPRVWTYAYLMPPWRSSSCHSGVRARGQWGREQPTP